MANLATKANLIYFKKMACPAIKPQMLEGAKSGMEDWLKSERKKGKDPTVQEMFEQATKNKDMRFVFAKATISDAEIMKIAQEVHDKAK